MHRYSAMYRFWGSILVALLRLVPSALYGTSFGARTVDRCQVTVLVVCFQPCHSAFCFLNALQNFVINFAGGINAVLAFFACAFPTATVYVFFVSLYIPMQPFVCCSFYQNILNSHPLSRSFHCLHGQLLGG